MLAPIARLYSVRHGQFAAGRLPSAFADVSALSRSPAANEQHEMGQLSRVCH